MSDCYNTDVGLWKNMSSGITVLIVEGHVHQDGKGYIGRFENSASAHETLVAAGWKSIPDKKGGDYCMIKENIPIPKLREIGEAASPEINRIVSWGICDKDGEPCIFIDSMNMSNGGDNQTVILTPSAFREMIRGFQSKGLV